MQHVLTHLYPIPCPSPDVEAVLSSLGPVLANALSSRFRVESQRDAARWAQEYAAGAPSGEPFRIPPTW